MIDTEEYYGGLYPSPPDPEEDTEIESSDEYFDEEFYREREVLGLWKD